MKNKLLLLLGSFMLLFLFVLISCEEECGPFPNKFRIVGLDWMNYQAIYSDVPNSQLVLNLIESDSVDYDQYSIVITPRQETYYAQRSGNLSLLLFQNAFACSPIIPETDEKIDSIVIVSAKGYDANHPAGSDLSDLFDVVVFDHVNNIYYEKYTLNNFVKNKPFVPTEMTLILREQPDTTTHHEFVVKYYQFGMDDNDYYEFTTNRIVIKRKG